MNKSKTARTYGKPSKRSTAGRLLAELKQSPIRKPASTEEEDDQLSNIASRFSNLNIVEVDESRSTQKACHPRPLRKRSPPISPHGNARIGRKKAQNDGNHESLNATKQQQAENGSRRETGHGLQPMQRADKTAGMRMLTWDDVCPPESQIVKIAEASFAEVYRVSNENGISIIKVIRLESPIKAQTKAQVRAGLVDEEPHSDKEIRGELQISEWLADIPGFVMYKEQYIVMGKAPKKLLETHQRFHRRMRAKDPDRLQFYPSPSRYLQETKFLVIELGDAGTALEDWKLTDVSELWDIFLLEAIALGRAENEAKFEHRDLHEGNVCVRQSRPSRHKGPSSGTTVFGYSGLDITILDYGLSRAQGDTAVGSLTMAYDLEKDPSLFTSTHASQCEVYRQMRSYLLRRNQTCIPPEGHTRRYEKGAMGPISWTTYAPYTNVLWLAYLYRYLCSAFAGTKRDLLLFKKQTRRLWALLDPEAGEEAEVFASANEVVHFVLDEGWIQAEQLIEAESSVLERESSIIVSRDEAEE